MHVSPALRLHDARLRASSKFSIHGVTRIFRSPSGPITALDPLDFEIRSGEFLCLAGPSGCGKSTMLKLLAGLDTPTAGEILLDGKNVTGPGPDRVVIFQESALFPWLTVLGNTEFGLKIRGIPTEERRKKALQALDMVHLTKFARAYPHQLSGGMKQRVALARGLVLDPDVLLMDEPFAALDAQTRDVLHEELQSIWLRTKKTIVFVTHNVREAARLGDRILLFSPHPGRIAREYAVDLPRPRFIEDQGVIELAREILADLKSQTRAL